MAKASLIRRVCFRATHHYSRSDWPEEENHRVFGSNTIPHEHDFTVEIQVRGTVDEDTGFVIDLELLDRILETEVVRRFDQKDLNAVISESVGFSGQPSTENLARWIWELVLPKLPSPVELGRVGVFESALLGAEYCGAKPFESSRTEA